MRKILASLVIAAILISSAAWAIVLPFKLAGSAATITTAFNLSRSSGTAPLAVHFDAFGSSPGNLTNSTITTNEFHEVECDWDFGDPTAGTWSRGAIVGQSRNTAKGLIAAHVFETAGVYTVTATCRDSPTSSHSLQHDVTVTAADATYSGTATHCVSNGSDFTGCPAGATTHASVTSFATVQGFIANDRRILMRRGDTFDQPSTGNFINFTRWHLGAYGSGAKPIVRATSDGLDFMKYGTSGTLDDIRFTDLDFRANGHSGLTVISYLGAGFNSAQPFYYSNVLFLRVDGGSTAAPLEHCLYSMQQTGYFVVDSTCVAIGFVNFSGGMLNSAILGSRFEQTLLTDGGEGNMRWGNTNKFVLSNNDIVGGQFHRQHLKLHAQAGTPSRYDVISENHLSGGGDQFLVDIAPTDANNAENVFDVVVERNWFEGNANAVIHIAIAASHITVRNNLFDMSIAATDKQIGVEIGHWGIEDALDDVKVYNNTMYSSKTVGGDTNFIFSPIEVDGTVFGQPSAPVTNVAIRNNFSSAPNYQFQQSIRNDHGRTFTASNNTLTNSPGWITATGARDTPAEFQPDVGSSAIGGGFSGLAVFSDLFRGSRATTANQGAVNP